jgi:hypothetical protein
MCGWNKEHSTSQEIVIRKRAIMKANQDHTLEQICAAYSPRKHETF